MMSKNNVEIFYVFFCVFLRDTGNSIAQVIHNVCGKTPTRKNKKPYSGGLSWGAQFFRSAATSCFTFDVFIGASHQTEMP